MSVAKIRFFVFDYGRRQRQLNLLLDDFEEFVVDLQRFGNRGDRSGECLQKVRELDEHWADMRQEINDGNLDVRTVIVLVGHGEDVVISKFLLRLCRSESKESEECIRGSLQRIRYAS